MKERHHGSTVFDRGRDVADQGECEHHHSKPHQDPPELTGRGVRLLHEEIDTDRDKKGRHRVDVERQDAHHDSRTEVRANHRGERDRG